MELLREWWIKEPGHGEENLYAQDIPTSERFCGHSIKWMCVHCGYCYAEMNAKKAGAHQVYSFIHAVCPACPGNRYSLPGSLECMSLIGWPEVPLSILLYQLDCELRFLDHPHHPHNMEY